MAIMSLWARLGLDKTGFDAGLAAAGKGAAKFGTGLKGQLAGAFGAAAVTAAILQFARSSIQAAESVGDLSDRLGISVKDANNFALAAKMGGADVEYFAAKLEKLRAYVGKGGSLSVFGIETKSTTQAMYDLARLIETTGLSAEQAVKFVEIFGKGSGKVITILGDLGIARSALSFSEKDVRYAQHLSDIWDAIVHSAKTLSGLAFRPLPVRVLEHAMNKGPSRRAPTQDLEALRLAEQREDDAELAAKAQQATQERIVQMEKAANAADEKARIDKLTDAQRLLEITKEQAVLIENLRTEEKDKSGLYGEGYYMMKQRLAELGGERVNITESIRSGAKKISADEFGRIGAFSGEGAIQAQTDLLRRQLTQIEQLRADLIRRGVLVRGTD